MKITELMDDIRVDEDIIEEIGFQGGCNLSKKGIKRRVFQKIGKECNNTVHVCSMRGIIAIAACAVFIIALVGWNVMENYGKRTEAANSFTMYAAASELKSNVSVLMANSGFEGSMSGDTDEGSVTYSTVLPFYCKGDNIKSITYKINRGAFQLADCPASKSLISKKVAPPDNSGYAVARQKEIYTEFTIDYKQQVKPGGAIRFMEMVGKKENVAHAGGVSSTAPNERKQMLDEVFKDVKIECIVNFNDGSKQRKKFHFENKVMTMQEANQGRKCAFPDRKDAFRVLVCE